MSTEPPNRAHVAAWAVAAGGVLVWAPLGIIAAAFVFFMPMVFASPNAFGSPWAVVAAVSTVAFPVLAAISVLGGLVLAGLTHWRAARCDRRLARLGLAATVASAALPLLPIGPGAIAWAVMFD